MSIKLNHTIIAAHDHKASAIFLAELFGLPAPAMMGPFAAVQIGDTSLDYMDVREYRGTEDAEIASQHYAFLVTEEEFDAIFGRIRARRLAYWADPYRRERDRINQWDGAAASISKILTGICWKSSPGPTAAAVRRQAKFILCLPRNGKPKRHDHLFTETKRVK